MDIAGGSDQNFLDFASHYEAQSGISRNSDGVRLDVMDIQLHLDGRSMIDRLFLRQSARLPLLHKVSFKAEAGDVLALLYSNELEMQSLFRLLSGHDFSGAKISGKVHLCGFPLKRRQLSIYFAQVKQGMYPDRLTVFQLIQLYSSIYQHSENIEDLLHSWALFSIRNRFCRHLSVAERIRLSILLEILRAPAILLISDKCEGADVYEKAFIVDRLRDWALKQGRIVIIATSSSQHLSMFSLVMLLSSGKTIFLGRPQEIRPYFSSLGYNCPIYCDLCDFIVDLATHDQTSPEASKESAKRIMYLSTTREQRKTPPNIPKKSKPPDIEKRTCLIFVIFAVIRSRWLEVWNDIWGYFSQFFLTFFAGMFVTAIYWMKPRGIHSALSLTISFSLVGNFIQLLFFIRRSIHGRILLKNALKRRLYGISIYLLAEFFIEIPFLLISTLVYTTVFLIPNGEFYSISSYLCHYLLTFCSFILLRLLVTIFISLTQSKMLLGICAILYTILVVNAILPFDMIRNLHFLRFPFGYILKKELIGECLLPKWKGSPYLTCTKKQLKAHQIGGIPLFGIIDSCSNSTSAQISSMYDLPIEANMILDSSMFGVTLLFLLLLFLCFTKCRS